MSGFGSSSLVCLAAAATMSAFFWNQNAYADSASDHLIAQGLFDEGLKLMDSGRFSEACPKLMESQRLDPGGGTLLNIALCHEKEGRLATATIDYENARTQAAKDQRTDRETFARTRIAQIGPRIPHVAFALKKGMPSNTVLLLDQNPVSRVAWGVPLPVDVGKHTVTVSAANYKTYSKEIELKDGEARTIEIPALVPMERDLLESAPDDPLRNTSNTNGTAGGAGASTLSTAPSGGRTVANPMIPILWITGAAGLGASAISGTWALASWVTYKSNCIDGRSFCRTEDGKSAAERARTMALISTVTLAVGAVALLVIPFMPKSRTVIKVGPAHVQLEGVF